VTAVQKTCGAGVRAPCLADQFIFDAAVVAADYLLLSVQVIDEEDPRRLFLPLDLNTADVEANYRLVR
jgi:hypothetical protein